METKIRQNKNISEKKTVFRPFWLGNFFPVVGKQTLGNMWETFANFFCAWEISQGFWEFFPRCVHIAVVFDVNFVKLLLEAHFVVVELLHFKLFINFFEFFNFFNFFVVFGCHSFTLSLSLSLFEK